MEDEAAKKIHIEALLEDLDGAMTAKIGAVYKIIVETVEKPLIERTLERTFGNQIKAAKILGINRNTLRSKMHKFGINPEKWKI
jgi:DNA-binding protein Fis